MEILTLPQRDMITIGCTPCACSFTWLHSLNHTIQTQSVDFQHSGTAIEKTPTEMTGARAIDIDRSRCSSLSMRARVFEHR